MKILYVKKKIQTYIYINKSMIKLKINYSIKLSRKILIQDLKNRLNNLEETRSKISLDEETMKELINGTPYRPRLNLLLQWAIEAFNYYHELYPLIGNTLQILSIEKSFLTRKILRYLLINKNIKQFNYKDEETIENLTKSFVEDRFKKPRIERKYPFLICILIN